MGTDVRVVFLGRCGGRKGHPKKLPSYLSLAHRTLDTLRKVRGGQGQSGRDKEGGGEGGRVPALVLIITRLAIIIGQYFE